MVNNITEATIVGRAAGLVAADMDGEKVMMNIEKGQYYALDGIGSRIWELMEKPQPVVEIVSVLLVEYEVTRRQCEDEVLMLLNDMYAEGLISIA